MRKALFDELYPMTELHEAVGRDDIEGVRRLLDRGADINARGWYETTPLMAAAGSQIGHILQMRQQERPPDFPDAAKLFDPSSGLNIQAAFAMMDRKREYDDTLPPDNPAIVSLLLERGAEVEARDEGGQTALMLAARAGRVETARVLLDNGADPNAVDNEHETPLMQAAGARRLEVARLLLERGADLDYRSPQGGTVLMKAAEGGRVEMARLLLAHGQYINTVSLNGYTALYRAAIKDQEEMVAFLKAAGAEISFLEAVALNDIDLARNLPTPASTQRAREWGVNALFLVVKRNRPDLIRLLLERGIDANSTGGTGKQTLMPAIMRGHVECVRALLEGGADPNAVPEVKGHRIGDRSLLGMAAHFGQLEIVELLLQYGATPYTPLGDGSAVIGSAVMFGRIETVRRLLEAGADPNGKVSGGMSLVSFATARGNTEMVRLLLEHGAKPQEQEDQFRQSLALAHDKPEIAAMLKQATGIDLHDLAHAGKTAEMLTRLDAGENLEARNERQETLLLAALRGKQAETAQALIARGADVNGATGYGMTPLMRSAAQGDLEMARLLLARSADIGATDGDGATALFWAARAQKTEMVALLAEAGGRIGPVEAAIMGDLATVRQLLNWGANVDGRGADGMTPLMGAALGGHTETIAMLLTRHAEIDAASDDGKTALAYAVSFGRIEAARLLLESGANVDAAAEDRKLNRRLTQSAAAEDVKRSEWVEAMRRRRRPTPLSLAVLHDKTDLAAMLIQHGANINSEVGVFGHSALAGAAMTGKLEMVRYLLDQGADPTLTNANGDTALDLARQFSKSQEIVALLEQALERS